MSNIEDKIKAFARSAAEEKLAVQKKAQDNAIKKDESTLESIISIVNSGLVYKEIGDSWSKKYVVVTEDILFIDYTGNPYSQWNNKTEVGKDSRTGNMLIRVNGYTYYHVGDILKRHMNLLDEAIEKTSYELDKLNEKRKAVRELSKSERNLKKIMLDHQINFDKIEELDI